MRTVTAKNRNNTSNEPKQDKFISKILENIDKVSAKDWENYTSLKDAYPSNLFTGTHYKGFNILALFFDTMANGFCTTKYATFNSISKAGGKLKKGAKGCIIEFFSIIYKHKETKKSYTVEQVLNMTSEQRKEIEKMPCIKIYTVFNSEFIENIQDLNLNIDLNDQPQENKFEEIQNCENFISEIIVKGNLNLKFDRTAVAFYSPLKDFVSMPERQFFISSSKYYSVLFHEIIHWTGNPDRLNRDLKGSQDQESYSFEELIAEMGAMLNCLQFGILEEFINSVCYLKSWSDRNSRDRETAIRKAFSESKKAKKYLEGFCNNSDMSNIRKKITY